MRVLQLDPSAAAEFAELQLHLYADYAPAALMDFLVGSQYYPLEVALDITRDRDMVQEQVGGGG